MVSIYLGGMCLSQKILIDKKILTVALAVSLGVLDEKFLCIYWIIERLKKSYSPEKTNQPCLPGYKYSFIFVFNVWSINQDNDSYVIV